MEAGFFQQNRAEQNIMFTRFSAVIGRIDSLLERFPSLEQYFYRAMRERFDCEHANDILALLTADVETGRAGIGFLEVFTDTITGIMEDYNDEENNPPAPGSM